MMEQGRQENYEMMRYVGNERECCGTCCWHQHEDIDDGWVCVCDKSEYLADWTEYEFCCDEWEEWE